MRCDQQVAAQPVRPSRGNEMTTPERDRRVVLAFCRRIRTAEPERAELFRSGGEVPFRESWNQDRGRKRWWEDELI